jgi:hypothetical protein
MDPRNFPLIFRWLIYVTDNRGWLEDTIYAGYSVYCFKCGACGCDGCCSPRVCKRGFLCPKLYTQEELDNPDRYTGEQEE